MTKNQKWMLFGIIVLALFFRVYQIAAMPGGLFPDEAAEGLDAHLIIQGQYQPFYERGNGREALFYYLIAAVITFFGTGVWQLHLVSAGVGFLSVAACFLMTRQLFSLEAKESETHRADKIALLATFFMAVSTWHIVLSRTAFRANLIPLFSALTFYLLLLTYRAKTTKARMWFAVLTGAVFAGGFYSYIAYRVLAGIIAILILVPLLASFRYKPWHGLLKKYWKTGVAAAIAFAIVIFPLFHYFYTHEGSFFGRSDQVSIFNPDLNSGDILSTFTEVTKQSLIGFFNSGDINWRHNISGEPLLSPFISPFFAIGLIAATLLAALYIFYPVKRKEYWKYALLAGSFWGLLLPSITTAEGIPHGLRSIGVIPFVYVLAAWGLYRTAELVKSAIQKRHWETSIWKKKLINYAVRTMLVCFFMAGIAQSYILYFVYAANSPENFYAFRSDLTVVSDYLNKHGSKENTYLVLDSFSIQSPEFLTTLDPKNRDNPRNQPYKWVQPGEIERLKVLNNNDQVVFTQSTLGDLKVFKMNFPESELLQETRNKFGQTVLAVYKIHY